MRHLVLTLALAGLLCGCFTFKPELKYYTLDMRPSGGAQPAANLQVEAIRVGEALARKDILILASPTEVEYYARGQWVAALDQLVRDKLHAEFGPRRPEAPDLFLNVEVIAFEQVDVPDGADALARMHVTAHGSRAALYETPLFEQTYEARLPAPAPGAGGVVEALSRCTEQIAARLAADLAAVRLD
jgi:uncharacterized lipoprotein YmbA